MAALAMLVPGLCHRGTHSLAALDRHPGPSCPPTTGGRGRGLSLLPSLESMHAEAHCERLPGAPSRAGLGTGRGGPTFSGSRN